MHKIFLSRDYYYHDDDAVNAYYSDEDEGDL